MVTRIRVDAVSDSIDSLLRYLDAAFARFDGRAGTTIHWNHSEGRVVETGTSVSSEQLTGSVGQLVEQVIETVVEGGVTSWRGRRIVAYRD